MSLAATGVELGNYMSFLVRRQEVIASNIANADTPGYKTLDVESPASFSALLEEAAPKTLEAPGLTSRNDGNNVGIDREARLLAETTMKFNVASQLLRGQLKMLRSAIEEGKS